MRRIFKYAVPVAVIATGLIGFKLLQTEQLETTPEIPKIRQWLVEAHKIELETLAPSLSLFGRVGTPSSTLLSSVIDAKVVHVNARPGQSVAKGDLLIQLNSNKIDQQVRQAQADVARILAQIERENQRLITDREILHHEQRLQELSAASLKRYETLKNRNVISQAEFDSLERSEQQAQLAVTARQAAIREFSSRVAVLNADLERARAALDKVRLDLAETMIYAPFDGRVTDIDVAVGATVRNGSPLIEIYDQTRTEVLTLIPNRQIEQVRKTVADHGTVDAAAVLDGQAWKLQLDRLSTTVDPGRGGVDAYFHFAAAADYPELGRSLTLELRLAPIDAAFGLPFSAVYGSNDVFKIESGQLRRVQITRLGQTGDESQPRIIAISDDLDAGDQVLITQLSNASDGLAVRVLNLP